MFVWQCGNHAGHWSAKRWGLHRASEGRKKTRLKDFETTYKYSHLSRHCATFRILRSCAWRYCSISRNVWGSFCLGKDWWCGEYQSKQDGWLARGERQILKEYGISMKYALLNNKIEIHSTYHRSFTNIKSLARNWRDAGICPRYAIDSGHNMATCKSWYFNVFHISTCFSKSSAREDSCPAVKSAAALSLAEFLPWRADLNRKSDVSDDTWLSMAILRESPTLRDLGSMDDYDLVFVYVDFITGLGMMAQNIATRRSRSNSRTHRMSLFCLMGKYGGTWSIWSHGFAPGLLSRCCLLDFEASHYCLSHTHTQSQAHQPSQHKCHYALCLSRCLTCS